MSKVKNTTKNLKPLKRLRSFSKNENPQENRNQYQSSGNLNIGAGINNIESAHNNILSNLKQIPSQNIPSNISIVKIQYKPGVEKLTKFGVIKAAPNQAAERLTDNPETALRAAFLSLLPNANFIKNNLSEGGIICQ